MKIIVLTKSTFFDEEATQIAELLQERDVDLLHIRKPEASAYEVERLINEIPSQLRLRLVLHDHFHLAVKHHLHGVHLNRRNPEPPMGWHGSVSRSCHTLDEVREWKQKCSYVSLSPIFDSISKQGYSSAFSKEQLAQAKAQGIVDGKVYALGGITFSRIEEVEQMGFGGAMILGDAWQ